MKRLGEGKKGKWLLRGDSPLNVLGHRRPSVLQSDLVGLGVHGELLVRFITWDITRSRW